LPFAISWDWRFFVFLSGVLAVLCSLLAVGAGVAAALGTFAFLEIGALAMYVIALKVRLPQFSQRGTDNVSGVFARTPIVLVATLIGGALLFAVATSSFGMTYGNAFLFSLISVVEAIAVHRWIRRKSSFRNRKS